MRKMVIYTKNKTWFPKRLPLRFYYQISQWHNYHESSKFGKIITKLQMRWP